LTFVNTFYIILLEYL